MTRLVLIDVQKCLDAYTVSYYARPNLWAILGAWDADDAAKIIGAETTTSARKAARMLRRNIKRRKFSFKARLKP